MTCETVSKSPFVEIPNWDADLLLLLLPGPPPVSESISSNVSRYPSCNVCLSKDSAVKGCDMSDVAIFARFAEGACSSGSAISSSKSRSRLFVGFMAASVSRLEFMLAGSRRARKEDGVVLQTTKDVQELGRRPKLW